MPVSLLRAPRLPHTHRLHTRPYPDTYTTQARSHTLAQHAHLPHTLKTQVPPPHTERSRAGTRGLSRDGDGSIERVGGGWGGGGGERPACRGSGEVLPPCRRPRAPPGTGNTGSDLERSLAVLSGALGLEGVLDGGGDETLGEGQRRRGGRIAPVLVVARVLLGAEEPDGHAAPLACGQEGVDLGRAHVLQVELQRVGDGCH